MMVRVFIATAVLFCVSSVQAIGASTADRFDVVLASSRAEIATYTSSHKLDDLRAAISDLRSAGRSTWLTSTNLSLRESSILSSWKMVFAEIDANLDPNYDSTKPPYLTERCVEPTGMGAELLPSCADPSLVTDESARNAYVAAIAANASREKKNAYQEHLQQIDEEAVLTLAFQLKLFRKASPTFSSDRAFTELGLDASRKRRVMTE